MLLASTLDHATPLVLAALGCLIAVRAGVINIAIEGIMLAGAFAAAAVAATTGQPWLGLAAAAAVGVATVAVLAWSHLHLGADPVLAGIAVNLLAAGATVAGLYALTRTSDGQSSLDVAPLAPVPLPFLADVPVLGAFAAASPLTWLTLLVAPLLVWCYAHTRAGLWVRAVGDNPSAAVEAGLSPLRIRWNALLASGLLAGVAGAQLSLFTTNTFVRDMTQGRGFIALGAVYLGLRHPVGTIIAATTFGVFEALSTVIQVRTSLPTDPILALPYVATIVALAVSGVRVLRRRRGLRLI